MNEDEDEFESMLEGPPLKRHLDSEALHEPIGVLDLSPAVVVDDSASVRDCVDLMKTQHVSAVAVTTDGKLCGIFTERDLVTKVIDPQRDWGEMPVVEFMTRDPECLRADQGVWLVLNLMHNGGYRHVPVVGDDGEPTLMISVRDIVDYLAEFFPEDVLNLPPDPTGEPKSRYGG
jgi:CBS domain-containing protein